jgi:hypothetical protein
MPIPLCIIGLLLNIAIFFFYITRKTNKQPWNADSGLNADSKTETTKLSTSSYSKELIQQSLGTLKPEDLWKLNRLYIAIRRAGKFDLVDVCDSKGNHVSIRFI